jgi:hypothetical protein
MMEADSASETLYSINILKSMDCVQHNNFVIMWHLILFIHALFNDALVSSVNLLMVGWLVHNKLKMERSGRGLI